MAAPGQPTDLPPLTPYFDTIAKMLLVEVLLLLQVCVPSKSLVSVQPLHLSVHVVGDGGE